MKMTARKAVDPIIATLLLIAIAVAAGVIVYVYVNSLAGGLTQSGGQQVSDQLSMDAFTYGTIANGPTVTVRDTGSSSLTISSIFFDGVPVSPTAVTPTGTCTALATTTPFGTCTSGQTFTFRIGASAGVGATTTTSGTSHIIKIATSIGGTSVVTVIAGRSG
jgi:flagellin-like protein